MVLEVLEVVLEVLARVLKVLEVFLEVFAQGFLDFCRFCWICVVFCNFLVAFLYASGGPGGGPGGPGGGPEGPGGVPGGVLMFFLNST